MSGRRWLIGATSVAVFALAAMPSAHAAPRQITQPDWLAKPSGEDVAESYPIIAQRLYVDGRATLACQVEPSGLLSGCVAEREGPAGFGFGAAVLSMARAFRMKPMTLNGEPVGGGQVRIPIVFRMPASELPATESPRVDGQGVSLARQILRLRGYEAATVRAYDADAQKLRLPTVTGASAEVGLAAAEAIHAAAARVAPKMADEAAAAMAAQLSVTELKGMLAFAETADGQAVLSEGEDQQAAKVSADYVFSRTASEAARKTYCQTHACEAGEDPLALARAAEGPHPQVQIAQPRWAEEPDPDQLSDARPTIAKLLFTGGYVRLTCTVDSAGALRDCTVAHQSPEGLGFGAAALKLRSRFRLSSTLVAEGASGERVAVILRFPAATALDLPPPPEPRSATSLRLAIDLLNARAPMDADRESARRQLTELLSDVGEGVDRPAVQAAMLSGFETARDTSRKVYASYLSYILTDAQMAKGIAFWRSPPGRAWAQRGPDLRTAEQQLRETFAERIYRLAGRIFCEERGCVSSLAAPVADLAQPASPAKAEPSTRKP